MRKILIAVILIGLVSCTQSTVEKKQTNIVIVNGHSKLNIVEIEGCEYFFSNYDRGGYCDGTFTLPEGEVFDIKKISINVGKIMNERFVMTV